MQQDDLYKFLGLTKVPLLLTHALLISSMSETFHIFLIFLGMCKEEKDLCAHERGLSGSIWMDGLWEFRVS